MIVTDHQLHYRHGWDGGQGPMRPCLEAFGRQGMVFDRAYCVTPLCGPARRSLLTGMYPHNHRFVHNQSDSGFVHPAYPDRLHALGYRGYSYGKWHAGPGTALDHGCEGFSPPAYGNPYITAEYRSYVERLGLPMATHRVDRLFWHDDILRVFPDLREGVSGYRCDRHWCGETALGITETPKETHECFFLAELACDRLRLIAEERCAGRGTSPFHLRVDFWGPHQPYFPTPGYVDLYDPELVPEYGSFRDDLRDKPVTYRRMNRPIADGNGMMIVPSVFSWEEWRRMLVLAYAQTTMVDDAAGRIVATLDALGLGDDTLVIWTSDHGDALASHGGMFDKGSFMTEETIRIPLAVRYPGVVRPGSRSQALVNSIDIAPTLMDAAGSGIEDEVDGLSLLGVLRGDRATVRERMLLESYGQGYRDTCKSRTIVAGDLKYTINEGDVDELYDLGRDPYELVNLHELPEWRRTRRDLARGLQDLLDRSGDRDMAVDPGLTTTG